MNFYQKTAKGYNELHGEEQRYKTNLIKSILKVKKNELLLDIGCASGISSDFPCKTVGIDPIFDLLKQNKNAFAIQSIGEKLPFKDKSFDIVVSVTSLHNFSDIQEGVGEIKRVGKRDFVFSVLKRSKFFAEIEKEMRKNFKIWKKIDGNQDWIFFCTDSQ